MKLVSIQRSQSPEESSFIRINARIEYDCGEPIEIWFEVPSELADELSDTGNPWLLCMLPYALERGEPIYSHFPVDPALLENIKGLVSTWCQWYPWLKPIPIEAPHIKQSFERKLGRTAAFFSGGVDSWFTILRHAPEREQRAIGYVHDLIYVHGFDIPLENREEFQKIRLALMEGAHHLQRNLIFVKTNLRQPGTLWSRGWGWLSHASGLAAFALILEKSFSKVLIGSTHPYARLTPWGSHPMTDILLSTSGLQVQHDGAMYNRVEKTELIARHSYALEHLHVCWKNGASSNCGACSKCIRTMATLHLLGTSYRETLFDRAFELHQLSHVYLADDNDEDFIREIFEAAQKCGNKEIEVASQLALKRSRRLRPCVNFLDHLKSLPVLWRLQAPFRRLLTGTDS